MNNKHLYMADRSPLRLSPPLSIVPWQGISACPSVYICCFSADE